MNKFEQMRDSLNMQQVSTSPHGANTDSSLRLKMIKNKLDKNTHNMKLDQIDNEVVRGHIRDVHYLLQNTEEIDWDVPIPFDKNKMWEETL